MVWYLWSLALPNKLGSPRIKWRPAIRYTTVILWKTSFLRNDTIHKTIDNREVPIQNLDPISLYRQVLASLRKTIRLAFNDWIIFTKKRIHIYGSSSRQKLKSMRHCSSFWVLMLNAAVTICYFLRVCSTKFTRNLNIVIHPRQGKITAFNGVPWCLYTSRSVVGNW